MQIGNFHLSILDIKFEPIEKDYQFYGSYYRGMLGRSLKRRFCVLRDSKCSVCPLNDKCLYVLSFEKYKDVLFPPYIINRSSRDSLRIVFIGSFSQFADTYIDAFRRLKIKKAGFYNPFKNVIEDKKTVFNAADFGDITYNKDEMNMDIRFIRLKKDSKMLSCEQLGFEDILNATEKRIYLINKYYGNPDDKVYIPDFNGKQDKVFCKYNKVYRYSNRQRKKMLIPSMSTKFVVKGNDVKMIYPYLYLATFLNIGTNAPMGFGNITIS